MIFMTANLASNPRQHSVSLCLGCLLVVIALRSAQCSSHVDHKGTYFVTSFLDINSTLEPALLVISQVQRNVSVLIRAPSQSVMRPINILLRADDSTKMVTLPAAVRMSSHAATSKGLEISSSHDIAVYSINTSPFSKDTSLVLPTDALGSEYVVTSYKPDDYYVTKAGIVGIRDNTVVLVQIPDLQNTSITIRHDGVVYSSGQSFQVALNAYETVQLNSADDISGLKLSSNISFALISGSTCVRESVPTDGAIYGYGHIEEQVIPTSAWGNTFIAIPFGSYDGGDAFKVVSSCDNTTLLISTDIANYSYSLSACEAVTIDLDNTTDSSYVAITADKPIALLQYYCSKPGNASASSCEPYLVTIPPVEQEEQEYLFSTPDNESQQLITLVMNSTHAQGLVIDGVSVRLYNSSSLWLLVTQYDSNYTAIRLLVESGYHNITNTYPSAAFSAISQSSPIGLKLDNLHTYSDLTTENGDYNVIGINTGNSANGGTSGDSEDEEGVPSNVIAVIVTLASAVFFVIVCILGFVLNETLCKDGCPLTANKIAPYHVT